MKRILVATDFTPRSDRALRRATLLARTNACEILLAHVVDDGEAANLVAGRQREAGAVLEALAAGLQDVDSVTCHTRLLLGRAPESISVLADEADVDLIVVGPPRPDPLREMFVGTTVERIIRMSRVPALLAKGVPAQGYVQALWATDFSERAAFAAAAAARLELLQGLRLAAVHAFDAPAQALMLRSASTMAEIREYLAGEETTKWRELKAAMEGGPFSGAETCAELIETSAAMAIRDVARRIGADLLIIGARGRNVVAEIVLGSVAQDILRTSEADVLVAPAPR